MGLLLALLVVVVLLLCALCVSVLALDALKETEESTFFVGWPLCAWVAGFVVMACACVFCNVISACTSKRTYTTNRCSLSVQINNKSPEVS
jgi:uncharacterized membrane protein